MARVKEIRGRRFGKLLVEDRAPEVVGRASWVCLCDCGTRKVIRGGSLRDGTTRSCGCLQRETASSMVRERNGAIGPRGSLAHALCDYKRNAQVRDIDWYLTDEQAREIMVGNCVYCGAAPSTPIKSALPGKIEFRNGIDRVDNRVGYSKEGNCVSCCQTCNRAKGALSKVDFLAWVSRIAQHQGFTTYNPPPTQEDNTMKWAVQ